MKKALVMMPEFMGYDTALVEALSGEYQVQFFESYSRIYRINTRIGTSRRIQRLLRLSEKFHMQSIVQEFLLREFVRQDWAQLRSQKYDLILSVNGDLISDAVYRRLRIRNLKARMVLFWWDDTNNLFKVRHRRFFRHRFSYNLEDCRSFRMQYLPVFVQKKDVVPQSTRDYDIAVIGTAHPDRLSWVKRFYEKYKDTYRFFIYMYHPSEPVDFFGFSHPLSYSEYLSVLARSRVVVDIPYYKQHGPSTRFFDALLTETKVLTVNSKITEYPVCSENIAVIDRENPEVDPEFVFSPYRNVSRSGLSAEEWISEVLR